MTKYIECDAAIEAALSCTDPLEPIEVDTTVESIVWKLRKLPMADVQPVKHGRWVSIGHKLSRICSICDCDEPYKFADDDANVYNYCPNCGAKMDGEA